MIRKNWVTRRFDISIEGINLINIHINNNNNNYNYILLMIYIFNWFHLIFTISVVEPSIKTAGN